MLGSNIVCSWITCTESKGNDESSPVISKHIYKWKLSILVNTYIHLWCRLFFSVSFLIILLFLTIFVNNYQSKMACLHLYIYFDIPGTNTSVSVTTIHFDDHCWKTNNISTPIKNQNVSSLILSLLLSFLKYQCYSFNLVILRTRKRI